MSSSAGAGPSAASPMPDGTAPAVPDYLRPSLFELLAQEQLNDLLHPVVRHVLSYLAQHYPRYFLRVLNHHEEVFALALLLVERHHLKTHGASLSEHFYQLRLASTSSSSPDSDALDGVDVLDRPEPPLSRRTRWGLLLFLVGIPYVRARAQDYFERLASRSMGEGEMGDMGGEGVIPYAEQSLTQRAYKRLYPYLNLAYDGLLLSYDILYLFERTSSYRPWHAFLSVRVLRDDRPLPPPSAQSRLLSLSNLPPLLPPLLLLLKLSQWWYSPVSPRTTLLPAGPGDVARVHAAIRPPRPLPVKRGVKLFPRDAAELEGDDEHEDEREVEQEIASESDTDPFVSDPEEGMSAVKKNEVAPPPYEVTPQTYGLCPLCGEKWRNPAVLPSGWVVCWRCGWDAVEGEEEEEEEEERVHERDADDVDEESKSRTGDVGDGGVMSRRKGRCPITGVAVAPGQLRRVLV